MDNPEKLATLGTPDTRRRQTKEKTQHSMRWITLFANTINLKQLCNICGNIFLMKAGGLAP